jgi:hypothetical protein
MVAIGKDLALRQMFIAGSRSSTNRLTKAQTLKYMMDVYMVEIPSGRKMIVMIMIIVI